MTKYEQKEQWLNSPKDWWYFTPKKTAADFYRDIQAKNKKRSRGYGGISYDD